MSVPGGAAAGVALVSGASRGIGRHLADGLESAGWVVERGSRAVADVTDRAAVQEWVEDVLERRGRIDLLVNDAGVIDAEVDLFDSDPDDWWHAQEVNVLGAYLLTRAVARHLRDSGRGGRVVNLSSGAALRPALEASAYNLSKTALNRLTGSTHLAGAAHGIRAFDLAPGVVRTDLTASMRAHEGRTEWTDPADVVALVLALASGELDAWSGRHVRAGVDTPESLRAKAAAGLGERDRTVGLVPWGEDDSLAP